MTTMSIYNTRDYKVKFKQDQGLPESIYWLTVE